MKIKQLALIPLLVACGEGEIPAQQKPDAGISDAGGGLEQYVDDILSELSRVKVAQPCDPFTGNDVFFFQMYPRNLPSIKSIESNLESSSRCGYQNLTFGQWVGRTVILRIDNLSFTEEALAQSTVRELERQHEHLYGTQFTVHLWPKVEQEQGRYMDGSTLLGRENTLTAYQYSIQQSGVVWTNGEPRGGQCLGLEEVGLKIFYDFTGQQHPQGNLVYHSPEGTVQVADSAISRDGFFPRSQYEPVIKVDFNKFSKF